VRDSSWQTSSEAAISELIRCGVVCRNVLGFVAQQELSILEADARDPQAMTEVVLQIVHPQSAKAIGTRSVQFGCIDGNLSCS
jgi:hypothetical protein